MSLSKVAVCSPSSSSESSPTHLDGLEAAYFIPGFVKKEGKLVSFDSQVVMSDECRYTDFHIKWTSKTPTAMKKWVKIEKHHEMENDLVACDGGCGHKYYDNQIVQFGNCDHNICMECVAKAKKKKMDDGLPSCCNENCSAEDMDDENDFCQMINLRVISYHKEGRTVVRRKKSMEVPTNYPLENVRQMLKSMVPKFAKYPVFYTFSQRFGSPKDAELVPWAVVSTGMIAELTNGKECITFLIGSHLKEFM